MQIVRRYKNLNWFDLLDRIDYDLSQNSEKGIYLEIMNELVMRKHESISEGGSYKLKKPCSILLDSFNERMKEDPKFANSGDFEEIKTLSKSIL